jgi:hypothetical protein
MPPSEERKNNDLADHGTLTKSLINKDMVKNHTKEVCDDDDVDDDDDDDTSIVMLDDDSSHGSNGTRSITADGIHHYEDNVGDDKDNRNASILSECLASHDSDVYDQLEPLELLYTSDNDDLESDSHSNNKQTNDSHHQIMLYYNSKTVSSTKSLSLVEVRNRLKKNLKFIQDVKALLGPFLDANSIYFTMEYCDVADRGMFHYLAFLKVLKKR